VTASSSRRWRPSPSSCPTCVATSRRTSSGRSWKDLVADDVNSYIKDHSDQGFSAKDFRTWNATVLAAVTIAEVGEGAKNKAERKRAVNEAIKRTAQLLNNTPAVCRSSYIDPRVFDCYDSGTTIRPRVERITRSAEPGEFPDRHKIEAAVLELLS
jgi:DNA topoisomerase I